MERRRFSRIIYQTPALIFQGARRVATKVQDLSLHGALLSVSDTSELDIRQPIHIEISLPDSDIIIQMTAHIVDQVDQTLRVCIECIDVDSITHLRRLVELNVGNDILLHRELEQLSNLGAGSRRF
jgi:hypothetical protein